MGCCSSSDNREETSQSDKETLLFSKTEAPVGLVQKMKSAFLRLPTSSQIVFSILAVFLFGVFLMNVGRTGNDGGRTENFFDRNMNVGAQNKNVQGTPFIYQSDFPPVERLTKGYFAELLTKGYVKKSNVSEHIPTEITKLIARFLEPVDSINLRSTGKDICATHAVLQCVLATDPYLKWALNTSYAEHKYGAGNDLSYLAKVYTDPTSVKTNSDKKDYIDAFAVFENLQTHPYPGVLFRFTYPIYSYIMPGSVLVRILNIMNQHHAMPPHYDSHRIFEMPTRTTIHRSDIPKDVTKVEDLLDNPNEFDDQEILIVELNRMAGRRARDTLYNPQRVSVSERLDGTDKELYAAVIFATHANQPSEEDGLSIWHFAAVVKKKGAWIRYSEDKDPVYLGSQLEDIKDFDSNWHILFFRDSKHFA
eukprot:797334_1